MAKQADGKKMSKQSFSDRAKVDALRKQMPSSTAQRYFNAGTNGPIPLVAYNAMLDAAKGEVERGRIGPGLYEGLGEDMKRDRQALADMFHADYAEIALMRSTTEGMNVALMGLEWRAGDEIITTQLEHICFFSVMALVARRHGVTVRTIDIGNGGGDVLGILEKAISPRTRVLAISHVQWSTGAIMPMKEIAAMATSKGVLTIVDAAQSPGQIPLNLHDLGVDAYAMAGQKWLCGPGGTGALYVRRDRIGDIRPTYIRYGAFDPYGFVTPPDGAARYEMGEMYNPAIRAQEAGLRWMQNEVGTDWMYGRIAMLGERLYDGLKGIKKVSLVTPRKAMAGLICFTIDGMAPKEINDAIYAKGHTIRYVDQRPGPGVARASTGWWTTEEEIDDLIQAVAEVAAGK